MPAHIHQLEIFEHDVLPAPLQRVFHVVDTACAMVEDTKAYFHRKVASYTSFFTDALVPKMAPPPSKAEAIRSRVRMAELDREAPLLRAPRVAKVLVLAAAVAAAAAEPVTVHDQITTLVIGNPGEPTEAHDESQSAPVPPMETANAPLEPDLVVFGPPTVFQPSSLHEADILRFSNGARIPVTYFREITDPLEQLIEERWMEWFASSESMFIRPGHFLAGMVDRMRHYPALGPRQPAGQDMHFCGCGMCPYGVAATRECAFLTIYRSQQRFRRRATTSPASIAASRWHNPCFTPPALQLKRT